MSTAHSQSMSVDVLIAGGGPAGLATAHAVLQARREDGRHVARSICKGCPPPLCRRLASAWEVAAAPEPNSPSAACPACHPSCRPGTRVAVMERSELRPRGAHFLIQPSGVRALEAISPELKQVGAAVQGAKGSERPGMTGRSVSAWEMRCVMPHHCLACAAHAWPCCQPP